MKQDFIWVRKVILNNDNRTAHYDSLLRLIELFTLKWKHNEKDPRFRDAYVSYKAFLKLTLKQQYN
jgi:hypothetical protein